MYIQKLGEIVPPPRIILWESATKSPFSSFTIIVLGWYPFLKSLMPLYQVPDIVDLTVGFKFLNVSFQICLLFVPKMSASITSYIVHIIYIASAWILYPLHFSLLSLIYEIYTFVYQTMIFAASIRADLGSL